MKILRNIIKEKESELNDEVNQTGNFHTFYRYRLDIELSTMKKILSLYELEVQNGKED